jgi:hypothetical protein
MLGLEYGTEKSMICDYWIQNAQESEGSKSFQEVNAVSWK